MRRDGKPARRWPRWQLLGGIGVACTTEGVCLLGVAGLLLVVLGAVLIVASIPVAGLDVLRDRRLAEGVEQRTKDGA